MIDKIDFLNKYTLNEHQVEILTGVDSNVQELPKLWQDILAISERQERVKQVLQYWQQKVCLLYASPSPRDLSTSRMPSSA